MSTGRADKDAPSGDPKRDEVPIELPVDLEADFAPLSKGSDRQRRAEPYHHDSLEAEKAFEQAVAAAGAGDEDEAVRQYLRAAKIAEAAREWYLAAVSLQRVGDFLKHPKPPCDLERALRMYRRAVAAYESCGLFAEARELSYSLLRIKLRRARDLRMPWRQRVEHFVLWLTTGFGWRPLRVLGTAVVTILVYGVVYWLTNGAFEPATGEPAGLADSVYFSGLTFTTVGYGDILPAPHARMLALSEGALGLLLMGVFVAVLARRLNKA